MQALNSLKSFFRPSDVTIALPDDPFVVIDREKAIERLKLDNRAEENGNKNFPPATATGFDDVESEIASHMAELANRAQIDAQANFSAYAQRLSELSLLRELSSITAASAQTLGDFQKTVLDKRNHLSIAADAVTESLRELAEFKRVHNRSGPAHKGMPLIAAYASIGGAWLVDALANTAFLRVNDDLGLIGGFVAAIIVAGLNVLVSAAAGKNVWPLLFHKDSWKRGVGIALVSLWLVLMATWNLLAGHFRDAKANGTEQPEIAALALFQSDPFGLDSVYSYGLLALGILFSLFAAGTGFAMDDPYPGYGKIYRRQKEHCDEYTDLFSEALDDLESTRDKGIEAARSVRDQLSIQFAERGQILAARQRHRERFNHYQEYLETIGNSLFEHYRAANIRARTEATPPHFAKRWELRRVELPFPEETSIDAEVAQAQAALDRSINQIREAYEVAIGSFETVEDIKRKLGDG